jgi:hypothetical protein
VSAPDISVVLPVYNQGNHIEAVVTNYTAAMNRLPLSYEILCVINGPRRDNSLEICQRMAREQPTIRALCIDEGGWGRAVRYGLGEARGRLLCYTNSARTTAEDLTLFILYGHAHPDVVIKANRKIRESVARRTGSLLYNLQCRSLFDLPCWDINGTPKVFPRSFEGLLQLERNDDLIDLEFNVVCRNRGYRMIEIPILSTTRHGGTSTTNYSSAVRMYRGAFELRKRLGGPP